MVNAPPTIAAYLMSCAERRAVRSRTLADLARTDWGAPPVVVLDRVASDDRKRRGSDTAHRLLELALDTPWDLLLFLEDDLEFNLHLRDAIEHWAPVVECPAAGHLFASLYNPNVAPLPGEVHGPTWFVADPATSYGAQAYLVARPTVAYVLAHWDEGPGYHDIRMTRLAARVTPLVYHRPSLVQHLAVRSTIGGVPHEAADFDAGWRPLVGRGPRP